MKKTPTILIIFILISFINLKGQSWQWARHFGSLSSTSGASMCKDANENIYITGSFSAPKGIFDTDTLTVVGIHDVYITKLDENGNFLWSKRAGGNDQLVNNGESGDDIEYESSTNSLIISGTMDGMNDSIGACYLGGSPQFIFLSNLDLSGNCIWGINIAAGAYSTNIHIALDNIGNIYMSGKILNSINLCGTILQPGCFIAKFSSSNGSCQWAKKVVDYYPTTDIIIHFFDNFLYLGGVTEKDTLILDTLTSLCNKHDVFISKFDTAGNVQWAKTMGGPNFDIGGSIGLDVNGNIYTSGTFQDTAYFDYDTLTNGNNKDFYFAKYDNNGNLIWINQAHTNAISNGRISTDGNGNSYVIGTFSGSATFGVLTVNATTVADMFVARYDSTGDCLGVRSVGAAINSDILTTGTGDCYVSGGFTGTTNFDSYSVTAYGNVDAFIAKHDAITSSHDEGRMANSQLIIYANPNAGKCNITVPDDFLHEKNLRLSIYDNTGKLIQQKNLLMNDGKIKLSLEAEAKGAYSVTLSNGKKSYNGKIVFE